MLLSLRSVQEKEIGLFRLSEIHWFKVAFLAATLYLFEKLIHLVNCIRKILQQKSQGLRNSGLFSCTVLIGLFGWEQKKKRSIWTNVFLIQSNPQTGRLDAMLCHSTCFHIMETVGILSLMLALQRDYKIVLKNKG